MLECCIRLAEQIAAANFHQVEAKLQKDCEFMKTYLAEKQEHANRQVRLCFEPVCVAGIPRPSVFGSPL